MIVRPQYCCFRTFGGGLAAGPVYQKIIARLKTQGLAAPEHTEKMTLSGPYGVLGVFSARIPVP